LLRTDSKKHDIFTTFCFTVRKNKPETREIMPADFADNAMERTQVLSGFIALKWGNFG